MVGVDGEPAGTVGVPEGREAILARAVRELVEGAASFRTEGRVTQLRATLEDADVFAVAGAGERTIVAVTEAGAAPGLVFYDLKRCLAAVADEA